MSDSLESTRNRVSTLMPALIDELQALVRIPSISADPSHEPAMADAAAATLDLLKRSGAENARLLEIPDDFPAVYAEVSGPPGAPTVLLYAHYDVQPAPAYQGWDTDPFKPVSKAGRMYGRGAADDKSGIAIHAGVLRAFQGKPPVNLRIVIEGSEESFSKLDTYLEAHPDLARCDYALIADMGNLRTGEPALTTALRGVVMFTMKVRTLDHPIHSGLFGGAAPDALLALSRTVSSMHDDNGDVRVEGLASYEWPGADMDAEQFRRDADVLDGVMTTGTGSLASRLWSRPSISMIGMDVPTVAAASNVILPEAAASISMRIAPGADPRAEFEALKAHLVANTPWGAQVEFTDVQLAPGFKTDPSDAAISAMSEAFDKPATVIGSGGAIPLVNTIQTISPDASMVLFGAEDMERARIHGSNESVDLAELERCVLAAVRFVERLAQ